MSIEYDLGGRVSRQEIDFVLSNNMSSFNYRYSQLGSLVRVDQNDQTRWSYAYDNDGGLVRSDDKRSRTTLRYDSKGRLEKDPEVKTFLRQSFITETFELVRCLGSVFDSLYGSLGQLYNLIRCFRQTLP